jgi:hypothetical protein
MGRTFYPEQPRLEPLGLLAEDDARQVQVALRRLHVRVSGLRHQRDRVRASRGVIRDRRVPEVIERRLTLPDDAEFRAHAANTIAKHSRRGWRLDRPNARVPNDSIIALAMALDACEQQPAAVELVGWI